jgi:transposase
MNEKEFYRTVLELIEPWEIESIILDKEDQAVHVYLEYPEHSRGQCPECGKESPIHDKREERVWRHLDSCKYKTYLHCRMPRTKCPEHGVKTMQVPWSNSLSHFTNDFECHAIKQILATKNRTQAALILDVSWDGINGIMQRAVRRGMSRRTNEPIEYLGIDEKSFLKGHNYVTVLTDAKNKRVIEVVENRDTESVEIVWESLSDEQKCSLKAISMDFWKAFISGAEKYAPQADIVHDRFHIMKYMNEAVNAVRKIEHRQLMKQKDETLKGAKYLFLKNQENFTEKEKERFQNLNLDQLAVGRAWNRRELLKELWNCEDEESAREFFKHWYFSATHSRLKPIVNFARMLKRHFENIITFVKHHITNAFAEGMNSVIQHIKASARGFRNFQNYRTAILFFCGGLNLFP